MAHGHPGMHHGLTEMELCKKEVMGEWRNEEQVFWSTMNQKWIENEKKRKNEIDLREKNDEKQSEHRISENEIEIAKRWEKKWKRK